MNIEQLNECVEWGNGCLERLRKIKHPLIQDGLEGLQARLDDATARIGIDSNETISNEMREIHYEINHRVDAILYTNINLLQMLLVNSAIAGGKGMKNRISHLTNGGH